MHNWVEQLVADLCSEDQECRSFLDAACELVPPSYPWVAALERVVDKLMYCSARLKSQGVGAESAQDQLNKALEACEALTQDVSSLAATDMTAYLAESWTTATAMPYSSDPPASASRQRRGEGHGERASRSSPKPLRRRSLSLKTVPGLRKDLSIGQWDFDALRICREQQHVLQIFGFEVLRTFSVLPRGPLASFLERLEGAYLAENPYHSNAHGADMCNSFLVLAQKSGLWQSLPDTCGIASLLAGLGHDVGHFKRNNIFLSHSRHALAVNYNDLSVMESYHAATLTRLLDEPYDGDPAAGKPGVKVLAELDEEDCVKARRLMIALILGTDTQKHLEELASFRVKLGSDSFDPHGAPADHQQALSMMFRAADIGHSAKGWELHLEWSNRIVQEFHEQGDEEKSLGLKVSPLCEREGFNLATSQVGFLSFICLPTWREIARFEELMLSSGGSRQEDRRKTQKHKEKAPHLSRTQSTLGFEREEPRDRDKEKSRRSSAVGLLRMNSVILSTPATSAMSRVVPVSPVPSPPGHAPQLQEKHKGKRERERVKWLAENVLWQCEQNFQTWKAEAQAKQDAADATPLSSLHSRSRDGKEDAA